MTDRETAPTDPPVPGPAPAPGPAAPRRIEIRDDRDQTVAAAEVTTAAGPEGTVRTSMHARSGHVRPGQRASLVDAVLELPEVQASERLEAAVPYGDSESLDRLRERTVDPRTRAAGATTLLDANLQADREPAPGYDQGTDDQPGE